MDDQQVWAVLRRQRHSFLNHLQVISGWLQMNQPERARRYLEAVAEDMSALGQATRFVPPQLGLVLLDLSMEAETYGARIDWHVSGPIAEAELGPFRAAAVKACSVVARLPDDQRVVTVTLGPAGFTIHTPLDPREG